MFNKFKINSFSFNFIILSLGNLLGRILGYTREIFIIKIFGVNQISDKLNILLITPDFINNFFSWSIIISTVLPNISISNGKNLIIDVRKKIILIALVVYLIYIVFLFFNLELNFIAVSIISASLFFNIYFSFTLIISQKYENFLFTSLANFIYNLGVLSALYISGYNFNFIAIIILIFSFIRFYFSKCYNNYMNFNLFSDENVSLTTLNIRSLLLAIFSQSIFGLLFLIDKFYASQLEEGTITLYSLVEKLYLASVTIFVISFLSARFPSFVEIVSDLDNRKNDYYIFIKKTISLSFILMLFLLITSPFVKYVFYNFIGLEIYQVNIVFKHYIILLFDIIPFSLVLFFINHLLAKKKYLSLLYVALFSILTKFIMLELFASSLLNLVLLNILIHLITLVYIIVLINKNEKNIIYYLWRRAFSNYRTSSK